MLDSKDNGLSKDDLEDSIIHAGTLLKNADHDLGDELEIFVHAPFSEDSEDVEDRNEPSIVLQLRLINQNRISKILITGDATHDILDKVVERSENADNGDYLYWDIYDIPHHVRSLSSIRNFDLLLSMAIGYIGILSEKTDESIEVLKIIEASKRLYGVSGFKFYAIAYGLKRYFPSSILAFALSFNDLRQALSFASGVGRKQRGNSKKLTEGIML